MEHLGDYLKGLGSLGVTGPISVQAAVIGSKGARVVHPNDDWGDNKSKVDRDMLFLPDVLFEAGWTSMGATLRPLFDGIWNAGGWLESPSYVDGEWQLPR
jgi:hypothetical protein